MGHRSINLRWLLTLVLLSTLILCIGGIPAMVTDPMPKTAFSIGFYALAYIGQNSLIASLLGLILLPLFLWVKSDRIKIIFSVLPVAFVLSFFIVTSKVFSFWRFYVSQPTFDLFFSKGGGSNVFEVSHIMYVQIAVAIILFISLAVFLLKGSCRLSRHIFLTPFFSVFFMAYVASQGLMIYFIKSNNMQLLQYAVKVPYFFQLSIANALHSAGMKVYPKTTLSTQLETVLSKNEKLRYPLHPLQYTAPKKQLNVLMIVIDTLRADMINPFNMPNVYQFSQHADRFEDNISGGDCTRAGIFSLFYGIPITYWNSAIKHHQGSIIIRAFQKNHYHFGLFASAGLLSPPFNRTVFETLKHYKAMIPGDAAKDRDINITNDMRAFLTKAANKHQHFFGFMFYDVAHAYNSLRLKRPFSPSKPLNYITVNNDTPSVPIFNLYENAVFYEDHLISKVFATLKKTKLLNNTVVIITSDHGQEFNEYHNNYWEHASGFSNYQMHTPMIVAWPGQKPHVFYYQTSHFDLAPMLLKHVLGVTNPASDYSVGSDLYHKKQNHFVIAGHYGDFALVANHFIMPFHYSGFYRFTSIRMQPLQHVQLSHTMRLAVIQEMQRFY